MASSASQLQVELLQIELAIELDQGKSVSELAEKFGVTIAVVNAVAKKKQICRTEHKEYKNKTVFRSGTDITG